MSGRDAMVKRVVDALGDRPATFDDATIKRVVDALNADGGASALAVFSICDMPPIVFTIETP